MSKLSHGLQTLILVSAGMLLSLYGISNPTIIRLPLPMLDVIMLLERTITIEESHHCFYLERKEAAKAI